MLFMFSEAIYILWLPGTAFRWHLSAQKRVGQAYGRMQGLDMGLSHQSSRHWLLVAVGTKLKV